MTPHLLYILLFFSISFPLNGQDIENGIFSCLSDKYHEKHIDWKNTCDSVIYVITGRIDSLDKTTLLAKCSDTAFAQKVPTLLRGKMLAIHVNGEENKILETCLSYFTHRDGHEQKIEGEAGEFIELVKRKATHQEYMQFFNGLSDELFMHPFYTCIFVTWMVNIF